MVLLVQVVCQGTPMVRKLDVALHLMYLLMVQRLDVATKAIACQIPAPASQRYVSERLAKNHNVATNQHHLQHQEHVQKIVVNVLVQVPVPSVATTTRV